MNNSSIKMGLAIGITTLFIVSSIIPMVVGYNTQDDETKYLLDNLRFVCTTPKGFDEARYEYYKEQLLEQHSHEVSNDHDDYEIVEDVEPTEIEEQQAMSTMIDGPKDTPWPMKCHDTHHTSQSPYSTVDTTNTEKWRFYFSGWLEDTPVIDSDGVIYCKGAYGHLDHYLYAIYPNGNEKWKYKTGGLIWGSSPAIAEDGTIYIGSWDCLLYAIYPNGTLKWKVSSGGGSIASSPAIAEDGTIYFGTMRGSDKGDIVAICPNGTRKWLYTTGYYITSCPAIGDNGTIYIGSGDTYLYAMNPNGTLKWRFKTGDYVKGPPSIAEDGTIYIGSYDGYLYSLYPNNGTRKWRCYIDDGTETNPSIGNDGTIYVGGNYLYAIYPNGTLKWKFNYPVGGFIHTSSPAVSADGTIYFGTDDTGYIVATNPDGTEKWRKKIANKWVESSPSIAEDGTVYIGSTYDMSEGYLYAFGVGELEADANGPYYGLTNQPVQFTGTSSGGYSPHSYHWDFGDTHTSEEQNPIHTYNTPGNYTVVLSVTDNKSNTAVDTTYVWIQNTNTAPNKPTINGPTHGAAGKTHEYKFTAIDPDNSIIYLYVDWGDNSNTGWRGPYNNGQQVTLSHSWSEQDTYTIKAKAKDPYDAEGPWGELEVTMPKNKPFNFNFNLLEQLLERFPILQKILIFLTI